VKFLFLSLFGCVAFVIAAPAKVPPVAVRVPTAKAWIGQRATFYVDLRAPGSFVGTASFELPQLSGTLLLKIGNPVVSSQEIEGESWFVQTHEFALFSQKPGRLELPAFPVSFSARQGFIGEATEVRAQTPLVRIEIQRPPGSEQIGFLVTTESLDVTDTWDTAPGPAQVGAMFKRVITQRASNLPGMALAATPATAPEGIRVYPGAVETNDRLERGDFVGERRERVTYLLQKSGRLTLPGLTYVWFNPKTQVLQSKTLPAITFEVAAPTGAPVVANTDARRRARPWLIVVICVIGLGAWRWQRMAAWGQRCWKRLNPPRRMAARELLRACRRHDAAAAHTAWLAWRNMQLASFQPGPELRSAVLELHRRLFGPGGSSRWQGEDFARAFQKYLASGTSRTSRKPASDLPVLNPQR
jgi:hypothetical protein